MTSLLLRIVPLILVASALLIWVNVLRYSKRPAVRAICWSLGFLTLAFLVQLGYQVLARLVPVPALPHYLMHVCGLVAAFWLAAFALHVAHSPAIARIKVRHRAWLLAAALAGLTAFYLVGPLASGLPRVTSEHGQRPFVVLYLAVFTGYLVLALIDVVAVTITTRHSPQPWLRRGLLCLGAGAGFGIAYAALRIGSTIAHAAGLEIPWTNAGPQGVGTYLMLAAIALMMTGIVMPPLGERWNRKTTAASKEAT